MGSSHPGGLPALSRATLKGSRGHVGWPVTWSPGVPGARQERRRGSSSSRSSLCAQGRVCGGAAVGAKSRPRGQPQRRGGQGRVIALRQGAHPAPTVPAAERRSHPSARRRTDGHAERRVHTQGDIPQPWKDRKSWHTLQRRQALQIGRSGKRASHGSTSHVTPRARRDLAGATPRVRPEPSDVCAGGPPHPQRRKLPEL